MGQPKKEELDLYSQYLFSSVLGRLLEKKGINSKTVCDACGINESTFSYWLQGVKRVTDLRRLSQLSEFFGVSEHYLINGEKSDHEKAIERLKERLEKEEQKRKEAEMQVEMFKCSEKFGMNKTILEINDPYRSIN
ncbi:MAG: helix-turn-helix domain-containing protein [Bacteriovoracaceae bacterium]